MGGRERWPHQVPHLMYEFSVNIAAPRHVSRHRVYFGTCLRECGGCSSPRLPGCNSTQSGSDSRTNALFRSVALYVS